MMLKLRSSQLQVLSVVWLFSVERLTAPVPVFTLFVHFVCLSICRCLACLRRAADSGGGGVECSPVRLASVVAWCRVGGVL